MKLTRDLARENIYIMYPSLKNSMDYLTLPNKLEIAMKAMNQRYPSISSSVKNIRKLPQISSNHIIHNLKIEQDYNVNPPPRVLSLGELNTNIFYKNLKHKKKRKQQLYNGLDNKLQIQFPIHHQTDFVSKHALGFKGRENIDLFKHYLRMYIKNKFKVNQIKKQRREKQNKNNTDVENQQQNNNNNDNLHHHNHHHNGIFKKEDDSHLEYKYSIVDSIFDSIQPLSKKNSGIQSPIRSPMNSQFMTSFKKGQDLIRERLNIQDFIVDKSLNDVIMFDHVIQSYEQSQSHKSLQQQQKQNLKNKFNDSIQNSLLQKITDKVQSKVNIVTLNSNTLPAIQDNKEAQTRHLIEEIFITQIIHKLTKYGLNILNNQDYKDFKRIVLDRKKVLQELQEQIRMERLYQIKQKMSQQYNEQREQQIFTKKEQYSKLKQDQYLKCHQILATDRNSYNNNNNEYQFQDIPNSSQEVSYHNTTGYLNQSSIVPNDHLQNLSIKLSPITKKNHKSYHSANHIKVVNTLQHENMQIGSINMSDLQTNREKGSIHLDFTNIERKSKNELDDDDDEEEEEYEYNENSIQDNDNLINEQINQINQNINHFVSQPIEIFNLQDRLKKRLQEKNNNGGGLQNENENKQKINESSIIMQQDKSIITNQSTRFHSQIHDSINKSNNNNTIINNNNNNNIDSNSYLTNQNNIQDQQIIDPLVKLQQEQDDIIDLLLEVAQKHGLEDELMKLFEIQEQGEGGEILQQQQPLSKEERDIRVEQFMKKVQLYIQEEDFQQKLKDKQKQNNIKFQKMEKKKKQEQKKKNKIQQQQQQSNQNISNNVLDDTSLLNNNFSRGPSLHLPADTSNINNDYNKIQDSDRNINSIKTINNKDLILKRIQQNNGENNNKKYISKLNFKNMKRLNDGQQENNIHLDLEDNNINNYSISKQFPNSSTTPQIQFTDRSSLSALNLTDKSIEKLDKKTNNNNKRRKDKENVDYYKMFNDNQQEMIEMRLQENNSNNNINGSEKTIESSKQIQFKMSQKQKETIQSKTQRQQINSSQSQNQLLQSMRKNNQLLKKSRITNSDQIPTKEQLIQKKQELQNSLKINFTERHVRVPQGQSQQKSRPTSPQNKSSINAFNKSLQQPLNLHTKKDDIVQQQRRELMIKYYGEEKREEILKNQYTLEEEKDILQKLKQREEIIKKKMNVAAKKMVIEQEKLDDIDKDMMAFQDILVNHKKANEKLFQKIVQPQKIINISPEKRRIPNSKKNSQEEEILNLINQDEDNKILNELKDQQQLEIPEFYLNQSLLNNSIEDKDNSLESFHQNNTLNDNINQNTDEQSSQKLTLPQISLNNQQDLQIENTQSILDSKEQINESLSQDENNSDENESSDNDDEEEEEEEEQKDEENESDDDNEEEEEMNSSVEQNTTNQDISTQQILNSQISQPYLILENDSNVVNETNNRIGIDEIAVKIEPNKVDKNIRSTAPSKKKKQSSKERVNKNNDSSQTSKTKKKKTKKNDDTNLTPITSELQEKDENKKKKQKKSPRVSIQENTETQLIEDPQENSKKNAKKKGSSPSPSKKKKKIIKIIESEEEEIQENDDTINDDPDTSRNTKKTNKKKKKADNNSNFLKIPTKSKPKKTTKEKRDTIQLEQENSSSTLQASTIIQQSTIENINNGELSPKSKKKEKEARLKEAKRQKMELEQQKKEEEKQRKEEEKRRKEEEKQRKEEERLKKEEERIRKEEEKRKIEQEKQRLKEERQKKFIQELEKAREFNFAEEMELLKKRKLTLRELKQEIQYTIDQFEKLGGNHLDDEASYNILSYKQRLEQIDHFLESTQENIELAIQNRESTDIFLSDIFSTKQRWTRDRYKEKKEIIIPEVDDGLFADMKGDGVGEQEIQLILKYASLNQDVDGILNRLLKFKEDQELLTEMKTTINNMRSEVSQIGLDILNYKNQKNIIESNNNDNNDNNNNDGCFNGLRQNTQNTQNNNNNYDQQNLLQQEQILARLRKLKKLNNSKFQMVIDNSHSIKDHKNFLKSINYYGSIDKDIINNQTVQKKQAIWNSKLNLNIY